MNFARLYFFDYGVKYWVKTKMNISTVNTRKSRQRPLLVIVGILLSVLLLGVLTITAVIPALRYNAAISLFEKGDFSRAAELFLQLGDYQNAHNKVSVCYEQLISDALISGDLDTAISYYNIYNTLEFDSIEVLHQQFYDYAVERMNTGSYRQSLQILDELIPFFPDSALRVTEIRYRLGMEQFEQMHYQNAYDILSVLDASLVPESANAVMEVQQAYYDSLVTEFEITGKVPAGFQNLMLNHFAETECYRKYRTLQLSSWQPEEHAKNIRIIYELDDFLDTVQKGFILNRIYGNRYVNESGSYLEMESDGTIICNLPRFRYGGYYGLYSKIEDDIYFIGSDEVM